MVSRGASSGSPSRAARSGQARDLPRQVTGIPPLTDPELSRLLATPLGPAAVSETAVRLVQGSLPLVLAEAEARQTETVGVEDLFQEGSAAVVTVVHGLDPAHPLSSERFLERVRGAARQVMDSMVEGDLAARREDERWAADAGRLFEAEAELRLESATSPSDLELASHLGWTPERVAQIRRAVGEARRQDDMELADILAEAEDL